MRTIRTTAYFSLVYALFMAAHLLISEYVGGARVPSMNLLFFVAAVAIASKSLPADVTCRQLCWLSLLFAGVNETVFIVMMALFDGPLSNPYYHAFHSVGHILIAGLTLYVLNRKRLVGQP